MRAVGAGFRGRRSSLSSQTPVDGTNSPFTYLFSSIFLQVDCWVPVGVVVVKEERRVVSCLFSFVTTSTLTSFVMLSLFSCRFGLEQKSEGGKLCSNPPSLH